MLPFAFPGETLWTNCFNIAKPLKPSSNWAQNWSAGDGIMDQPSKATPAVRVLFLRPPLPLEKVFYRLGAKLSREMWGSPFTAAHVPALVWAG